MTLYENYTKAEAVALKLVEQYFKYPTFSGYSVEKETKESVDFTVYLSFFESEDTDYVDSIPNEVDGVPVCIYLEAIPNPEETPYLQKCAKNACQLLLDFPDETSALDKSLKEKLFNLLKD